MNDALKAPAWALNLRRMTDYVVHDFLGGPRPWKFAWGAVIEFNNWVCPLTPLEQRFRLAAGEQGYSGGFVEHYVLPLLYPEGLTREIQLGLGLFVLGVNALVYGVWLWRNWLKRETIR